MTPTGTTYESTVNYTYDAGNRLRTAVDSISGTITRGYDNLDRLTSEATPQGTVSYTYDNAGRRASLTVPGQSVVNYSFDAANRLAQITQGSATVQFSYDADNRRTSLTLPNGVVTTYSYDTASQLTGMTYTNGSTALGNLAYSHDLNGRRTNAGGSYARTNLPNAISATAYNANNQLTTWGTANLFYDLNGNMTSDGTHSYTWDARNRLNQIDLGNTASFTYDPFRRRATKNILATTTSFLYDRANAVQEVIGGTNTANSLMGGVDEVFQRTDSVGARSFLSDALGGTLALTDSTGTAQTSYTYEPFGNTSITGAATTNSFAYTGRELDATGLYFYRARYYNPQLQRFISEDPLGLSGGDVNTYGYALQSPTNYVDPFGLICVTRWIFVSCDFESFELWTMMRAEEAHEQQHVKDNWYDPFNLYRGCEEKERRGFEVEVSFLKSTIATLEGRKSLPRYSQLDLEQARQMLRDDEDHFKNPFFFSDYCKLSKPVK